LNNGGFSNDQFLPDFFEFIIFVPAVQTVGYRLFVLMKSSFSLHQWTFWGQRMPLPGYLIIHPLSYAGFTTLVPRRRLKAICRNSASRAFLINFGNLARYALLYKWLNPKYCSTIYRTLEIALFRSF
jgi:hypothetical protein